MESPYNRRGKLDEESKVFTIPISRSVRLFGPELEIIDTPEFQRLAGIKQLGTSYFVFRGAVHTRFEHSLGTVHAAQRIVNVVNANPKRLHEIDKRQTRLVRLFALLHDLPHIPFGHTLEDEFGLLERHDENDDRMNRLLWDGEIGRILHEALEEDEFDLFRRIVEAKDDEDVAALGTDAFLRDVVANTVCADAIDYVQRDLGACGMPVELGERFLEYFNITADDVPNRSNRSRMALALEKRSMPRPDVESEVVKLLSYRYELAERVYFHHAKNAASVMIGRGVQALGLQKVDENFDRLSDDLLLAVLANPELVGPLGLRADPEAGGIGLAQTLGELLARRRLYKIAYLGVADDFGVLRDDTWDRWGGPEKRRELETLLTALAGLNEGDVLVHLPPTTMAEKDADVRVLTSDSKTVVQLSGWDASHSRRIASLNDAHRRLWRVAVYVHPDVSEDDRRLVTLAAERELKVQSRYVERAGDTYLEAVFDRMAGPNAWSVDDRVALVGQPRAEAPTRSLGEAEKLVEGLVKASRAASTEDGAAGDAAGAKKARRTPKQRPDTLPDFPADGDTDGGPAPREAGE